MRRRALVLGGAGVLVAGLVTAAPQPAAAYPDGPITMVVGFGAGGMTDVSSRIFAEKLEEILGVRVLVENKPGAGGTLAWTAVQELPADGHTLVSFASGGPINSVFLGRELNLEDWVVLGSYMPQERVLFARQDAPFQTMDELMAYAKETPVTFADGGSYWSARVVEAWAKKHDLTLRMVPFRSGAEGSAAILGGHVTLAETGVGTSAWHAAREGGLKMMAVITDGDLAKHGFPDVPNLRDFGADYVVKQYYAYALKAGTPEDALEVLNDAFRQTLDDPEVQQKLTEIDLTPEWMPPDEYEQLLLSLFEEGEALKAYLEE